MAARAASVAASVVEDILVWWWPLCACGVTEVWGVNEGERSLKTPEGITVFCVCLLL